MRTLSFSAAVIAAALAGVTLLSQRAAPQETRAGFSVASDASDEFVGPFPSWANVKTKYGAAGDGASDDTDALQRGLTDIATRGRSPVLFLPAGTYRITRTLTLLSGVNVAIVGADPASTTLVWDGEAGGAMLALNGVAYSSVSRLTFDGKQRAGSAVDQSWDNKRPAFDTGNLYADDRFVDVAYGIHGGFKGAGFAETSIVRSRFLRNTTAGVALGNFNALDIWIWDSRFQDCAAGVSNAEGAGNFHVYSSVFRNSQTADLIMGNTGGFSARDNDSRGSHAFFVSSVAKAYPAPIHLQRNTIVDPESATPIDLRNQGPGLLTDNIILLRSGGPGPVVRWRGLGGADVTSIGNRFNVVKPIETNGRLLTIDDRAGSGRGDTPPEPVLPGTPPSRGRQVVEVTAGADAREIQAAIDRAALANGARPVVHIPYGAHAIDATLTIPRSDIQLVGDGFQSILRWSGSGAGPVVRLLGPSSATIRDLQIDGHGVADGVLVEHADAPAGRVFLEQVQLRYAKVSDLFVNALDETLVQARDLGHAYSPNAAAVRVVGGPALASGRAAAARTNILSGAASGNGVSYDVSGGAHVLVRDLWYESGKAPGFATIRDRATWALDGSRVATAVNQIPAAIDISSLDGTAAIVASDLEDRVAARGVGANARVLVVGISDEQRSPNYVENRTSPPAKIAVVNSRHKANVPRGNPSVPSPDRGIADRAFIAAGLDQIRREKPVPLKPAASGAPDVRLLHVLLTNGLNNLTIAR